MNNFLPAPRGDGERSQGLVETRGIAANVRGKLPVAPHETLPAASQAARGGSGGKGWRPSSALSPLDVWTAIRDHLRIKLGEKEHDMWVRHARLMTVLEGDRRMFTTIPELWRKESGSGTLVSVPEFSQLASLAGAGISPRTVWRAMSEMFEKYPGRKIQSIRFFWEAVLAEAKDESERMIGYRAPRIAPHEETLLVCMPRKGEPIFGAMRYLPQLETLALKMKRGLALTVQMDEWQIEKYGAMGYSDLNSFLEPAPSELWKEVAR